MAPYRSDHTNRTILCFSSIYNLICSSARGTVLTVMFTQKNVHRWAELGDRRWFVALHIHICP